MEKAIRMIKVVQEKLEPLKLEKSLEKNPDFHKLCGKMPTEERIFQQYALLTSCDVESIL